jgi:hypothetical protein
MGGDLMQRTPGDLAFSLLVAVVCSAGCSCLASRRGQSPGWGAVAGLLLGPIGFILPFVWRKGDTGPAPVADNPQLVDCPHCGKTMVRRAVCPYCGYELNQSHSPVAAEEPDDIAESPDGPPGAATDNFADSPPSAPTPEMNVEPAGTSPHRRIGLGVATIALILPLIGAGILFVAPPDDALMISGPIVLVTSLLMAVDAYRLGRIDARGAERAGGVGLFFGMIVLWIVVYPFSFFRRSRIAGPNLTIPALVVAAIFMGSLFYPLLRSPDLPTCTSREVVEVVDRVIRKSSLGPVTSSIDGHRELSFDKEKNVRRGQCVVHTRSNPIVLQYRITWADRDKGRFEVRVPGADLPTSTSPEVVELVDHLIRKSSIGPLVKSINGYCELSFDPEASVRRGKCIVHTGSQDLDLEYRVTWGDRDQGQVVVRVPGMLPTCESPEVVHLVDQFIRKLLTGTDVKSIDGYRELSFDMVASTRQGRCVAHTGAGDIEFRYSVNWSDPDKGQFEVLVWPIEQEDRPLKTSEPRIG